MAKVVENIKRVIDGFVKERKSGIIVVRREFFGDPVLTLYMYRGKLLHATSFISPSPWWEGLLDDVNILSSGGNPFRYAAEKYYERYLEHLVKRAEKVMKDVVQEILQNGWGIEIEVIEREDRDIEYMFGLDIIHRRMVKEREVPTEKGTPKSIVLSLINRDIPPKEQEPLEEEDVSLMARAMGFSIIYVPGEEDRYGFLRTLREFGAPLKGEFEEVRKRLRRIKGTLVLMFPYFLLVRIWAKGKEVWALSMDVKKVAYTLKYTDAPKEVAEDLLKDLAGEYGITFAWREGENTIRLLGPGSDRRLAWEEFLQCCEGYLREFKFLIEKAIEEVPGVLPISLKKIEVVKLLQKNPDPEQFRKAFLEKFGVKL